MRCWSSMGYASLGASPRPAVKLSPRITTRGRPEGTGVADAAGLAAAGALTGAARPAEPSRGPESHAGAASEPMIAAAAIRRRNVEGFIDPDVCAAALRA